MVDLHELSGKFDEGPFRLLNVFPSEHQKALYPGIRHRLYELRPLDALHHRRVPVVCFQVQLRAMDCETRDEQRAAISLIDAFIRSPLKVLVETIRFSPCDSSHGSTSRLAHISYSRLRAVLYGWFHKRAPVGKMAPAMLFACSIAAHSATAD